MAYTKTTWANGTAPAINAANLQNIEDQIDELENTVRQLDYGKVLHLSADGLPEYPDSTAGTTYLETAFATASGFSALDTSTAALTVSGGELILAVGASPTTYVAATKALDVSSKTVRVKWRCAQTDLTTMEIGTSGAGTHVTKSIAGLTSGITDITTGASFTDFEIRFNSTGNHGASPVYIDFVYVGDGTNSSKMPDVSGNGNDATVYGCTPVDGIAGKELSLDGVNDWATTPTVQMPTAFSISMWASIVATASLKQLLTWGAFQADGVYIDNASTTDGRARFVFNRAGATEIITTDTSFLSASRILITLTFDSVTKNYVIYKNGVPAASGTLTNAIVLANRAVLIGVFNGATGYWPGTLSPPRIYNRFLSAAEVWELYQKPKQAGGPVTGPSIRNLLGSDWTAPAAITTPGVKGQIAVDTGYLYIHTGVQWERVEIATW